MAASGRGPIGGTGPGVTVRPDFWHDRNVGALAVLGIFLAMVLFAGVAALLR